MTFLNDFKKKYKEELKELNGLKIGNEDVKEVFFNIIEERIKSSFFSTKTVEDAPDHVKTYYIVKDDYKNKYIYEIEDRNKILLGLDSDKLSVAIENVKVQKGIKLMNLLNVINDRFFERSNSSIIQYIVSFKYLEGYDDKAKEYKNIELSMGEKNHYYFKAKFFKKLIDIFINTVTEAKEAVDADKRAREIFIEEAEENIRRHTERKILGDLKQTEQIQKKINERNLIKITHQEAEIKKIRNEIDKIDEILSEIVISTSKGSIYTKSIIDLANRKKNEALRKVSELDNILNGFKNIVNEKDKANEIRQLAEEGKKLAKEGQKLAEEGQKLAEIAFELEKANQKIDKAKKEAEKVIAKSDKAKKKVEEANKATEDAVEAIIEANIIVKKLIKNEILNNYSIEEIEKKINHVKLLVEKALILVGEALKLEEKALKLAEKAKAEEGAAAVKIQAVARGKAERMKHKDSKEKMQPVATETAELDKAATRIQSIARGKAERKKHVERKAKKQQQPVQTEAQKAAEEMAANESPAELDKAAEAAPAAEEAKPAARNQARARRSITPDITSEDEDEAGSSSSSSSSSSAYASSSEAINSRSSQSR